MAIQQSINNMLGTVGTVAGIASALDKSAQKEAAKAEYGIYRTKYNSDVAEAATAIKNSNVKADVEAYNKAFKESGLKDDFSTYTDQDYETLGGIVQKIRQETLMPRAQEQMELTGNISQIAGKEKLSKNDIKKLEKNDIQVIKGQNGTAFYDKKSGQYMSQEEFQSKAKQDRDRAYNRLREYTDRQTTTEELKFKRDEAYKNYQTLGKGLIGKMIFNMKEGNK